MRVRQAVGSAVFAVALLAAFAVGPRLAASACPEAIAGWPRTSPAFPAKLQLASLDGARANRASAQQLAAVPPGKVRITFSGHASFFIESPAGVAVFTDFNDQVTPPRLPDFVTMNRSHTTHYTDVIPPGIGHVLRGWKPGGGIARHNVRVKDMLVRNVPTNIGEYGDIRSNENSIFVIETAFMCLAHLSHLHHVLSKDHVAALGEIDILFVPIDGGLTMSHDEAFHIMGQLKPGLVIPMHFGFGDAATIFTARARESYAVKRHSSDTIVIGRGELPRQTEILFLLGF